MFKIALDALSSDFQQGQRRFQRKISRIFKILKIWKKNVFGATSLSSSIQRLMKTLSYVEQCGKRRWNDREIKNKLEAKLKEINRTIRIGAVDDAHAFLSD